MGATKRKWVSSDGSVQEAWAVSFYDPDGKRCRKSGFKSKREAETWERNAANGGITTAPTEPPPAELTINEACQEWLRVTSKGHGSRPPIEHMAWRDYELSVRVHIVPRIGIVTLSALTSPDVAAFRQRLLKEVSRDKAMRVLKHLRQALNYAVEIGNIPHNPATSIRVSRDLREDKPLKIPSREEMRQIIAEMTRRAKTTPAWVRFTTMFMLLQGGGLRISEARGLPWSLIDLNEGVLLVRQRVDKIGVLGQVKSPASRRSVVLDDMQIAWLRRWQPICPAGKLGLVFPNDEGGPLSYQGLYFRYWRPLLDELGLVTATGAPRYSFHDTRHYRVSELIAAGANVREVMSEIGHVSSALTLDRYGHLFPEDLAKRKARAKKIAENLDTNWSQNTLDI